jgi:ligand-binding sensor domain-containing protein
MDGGGVSRLKDGVITSYTSRQGLTSNYGGSLYESQDGSLWVGTDRGLNQIRDGRISKYTGQGALPGWYIHMVADDQGGMLLSVTSLRLRLLRNDRLLPYSTVKLDDDTFSIHRQADGTIWFCTSVGLVRHKQGQTRWYTSKDGLASNLVYSVYEDQKGGIWIATGKGLSLWKDGKLTTFGAAQGLFDQHLLDPEAADSNFWISSYQGIYQVSTGLRPARLTRRSRFPT